MQNPPKNRRRPSLSNDLIFEILVRLPAKSVGRFRCVSKRWLSDLTDPNFIRAHSSLSPTSGFFLFTSTFNRAEHIPFDSESRLSDPTLSFLDNDGLSPEFFDCCNGLILCGKPYRSSHRNRKIAYALAVCNPLTRECHIIPVPDSVFSKEAFLAFDPSVSPHFKIVSVRGGVDMFIYSSETRKWKLLTKNLRTEYNNIHFGSSTLWNGNLVWNSFRGSSLCLDVRKEQLKWLPLPVAGEDCWCRYRGESGGRLHYIGKPVPVTHESITHFDIWELTAGSTEWSVLYEIDIEHIKDVYPDVKARVPSHSEDQQDLRLEVVHFFRDEGGAGDRLLLSVPGKIACYHLRDMSFTTVCNGLPVYRHRVVYSWRFFHHHAHTLSPLNDNENENENAAISSHQDWICWPSEHDQLLMDLMVENSLKGQKGRSGFRIGAWRDMVEKLNENAQLKYDVSNLKNRLMSYRRDFCNVNKMLTYRGFSWDPVQQMVVAGDAEWRERLKWNCGAALFRRKQVPLKKLEIICASLTTSCQETKLPKVADAEIIANDDEGSEAQVDPAIQQDDEGNETQDISGAENVHGAETTKLLFDNCLEELDAMEDVDNDLYVKALFIFKEEYNQHVFLKTKGVRRLMWLREAARHLNRN